MKKLDDRLNKKKNNLVGKFLVFAIVFMVIVGFINSYLSEKKAHETAQIQQEQRELERKKVEEEKALAYETVEGWLEYNNIKSNYDTDNKIVYVTLQFGRTLSVENRISIANQKMYDTTKELESLFKDDIDKYVFNCTATTVDAYGNKNNSVVYSIILDRSNLNKVNWDGIEPSMLIKLASKNYKSPALD